MNELQADYVTCRSQQQMYEEKLIASDEAYELKYQVYEEKLQTFEEKQIASDDAYRRLSPLLGKLLFTFSLLL